jgi:hypothetical protein
MEMAGGAQSAFSLLWQAIPKYKQAVSRKEEEWKNYLVLQRKFPTAENSTCGRHFFLGQRPTPRSPQRYHPKWGWLQAGSMLHWGTFEYASANAVEA